ncbi:hypothetical protein HK101_002774, partial [Irineochytrium annulatum]
EPQRSSPPPREPPFLRELDPADSRATLNSLTGPAEDVVIPVLPSPVTPHTLANDLSDDGGLPIDDADDDPEADPSLHKPPRHHGFHQPRVTSPARSGNGGAAGVSPSRHPHKGASSQLQATLNGANVMLGMGILAMPYAMASTGWVLGVGLLVLFAALCARTAKVLARCMSEGVRPTTSSSADDATTTTTESTHLLVNASPRKRQPASYAEIGDLAFGAAGRHFITTMFTLELFAAATALVIICSDSLHVLFPDGWSLNGIKLAVTCVFALTTLPRGMGLLAYGSGVGILTVVSVLGIVAYNGLTKMEAPGSVWMPEKTGLWPKGVLQVFMAGGLYIVNLDAHAVFPSLYRDLKQPSAFPRVVNTTYSLNLTLYLTFSSIGYLMFGQNVLPEITRNLPSDSLTHALLIVIALNPITKFALLTRPVTQHLEHLLRLPPHHDLSHPSPVGADLRRAILLRACVCAAVLGVSIGFPEFYRLMGLLGSCFSFTIAIVFPELCWIMVGGVRPWWERAVSWTVVVIGSCFAVGGTIAALS